MVNKAVISSTNAYRLGKGFLQLLQRPFSKKYPKTGILSNTFIGALHKKQWDLGLMMLILFGTL